MTGQYKKNYLKAFQRASQIDQNLILLFESAYALEQAKDKIGQEHLFKFKQN